LPDLSSSTVHVFSSTRASDSFGLATPVTTGACDFSQGVSAVWSQLILAACALEPGAKGTPQPALDGWTAAYVAKAKAVAAAPSSSCFLMRNLPWVELGPELPARS